MYSASFIFQPIAYDARFHALNALIDAAAKGTSGYRGVESWRSSDGKVFNAVYYWDSLDALHKFSVHPLHVEAKSEYQKWYCGYQIVIAQILKSYGDGNINHATSAVGRLQPQDK